MIEVEKHISGVLRERDDYPKAWDATKNTKACWLGNVYFMRSSGGGIVRFWRKDNPNLPSFAGRDPRAPKDIRDRWLEKESEMIVKEAAKKAEIIARQRATGCKKFVAPPTPPRYCVNCGFGWDEHPEEGDKNA